MNKKNIFLVLSLLLVIFFLNIFICKSYEENLYSNLNNIINNIVEEYPELESITIDSILKFNDQEKILNKYGINKETIKNLSSTKNHNIKIITITTISYLTILLILLLNYFHALIKTKKELKTINNYLEKILQGTYELNIADYNEDELSILKNDIYKVTIKLKELSLYEKEEKVYLMNTLEDISHQLKTPLTALMVTNDILKNDDLTPTERKDFLNKSTKELEKMEWLITTLLKYSKLDSNSVKLKKETIKVKKLIEESLEALSIPLDLKNAQVELENLSFDLICDINWTKEALINILKNACEHINIGGEITIIGENNPLYKRISITDNGVGIKKSDIKNIFKRFYSANNSKNNVGIGLNMAKLIFEKEGGKIEVESSVGNYTTFKITFLKKNC